MHECGSFLKALLLNSCRGIMNDLDLDRPKTLGNIKLHADGPYKSYLKASA